MRENEGREEESETERKKREHLAASHKANTLQSVAVKKGRIGWRMLRRDRALGGDSENLACILKTHVDAPVHLSKEREEGGEEEVRESECRRAQAMCVHDEAVRDRARRSNRTLGSRMILLLHGGRLTNTVLLPLFKVVSASHAACLISRFSFGSNSLNTAEMRKKKS